MVPSKQPAYHSKKNEDGYPEACSCAICPLKTEFRGPADVADAGWLISCIDIVYKVFMYSHDFVCSCSADKDDIIDEVLMYFRANVLFRNFEVKGGADKTLIYLTLHAVQCLVKLEKIEDKNSGEAYPCLPPVEL